MSTLTKARVAAALAAVLFAAFTAIWFGGFWWWALYGMAEPTADALFASGIFTAFCTAVATGISAGYYDDARRGR